MRRAFDICEAGRRRRLQTARLVRPQSDGRRRALPACSIEGMAFFTRAELDDGDALNAFLPVLYLSTVNATGGMGLSGGKGRCFLSCHASRRPYANIPLGNAWRDGANACCRVSSCLPVRVCQNCL